MGQGVAGVQVGPVRGDPELVGLGPHFEFERGGQEPQGLIGIEVGKLDDHPVAIDHRIPRFHTCKAIRPH